MADDAKHTTHGSPELDEDAAKLAGLGADPGPTLADLGLDPEPGWIEPRESTLLIDYWVTRRDADATDGYRLGLPDLRERYRWTGTAWVTGYHYDRQGRRVPNLSCLHSHNGWRIEGRADAE